MWHLAADLPTTPADNTGVYLVFFGTVVASLAGIAVAYINNRKKSDPVRVNTEDGNQVGSLRERLAVAENELKGLSDDHDELSEIVEIVDRRTGKIEQVNEQVVKWLDDNQPGWR